MSSRVAPGVQLLLELRGLAAQLGVAQGLDAGLDLVDGGDVGEEPLDVALVLATEYFG